MNKEVCSQSHRAVSCCNNKSWRGFRDAAARVIYQTELPEEVKLQIRAQGGDEEEIKRSHSQLVSLLLLHAASCLYMNTGWVCVCSNNHSQWSIPSHTNTRHSLCVCARVRVRVGYIIDYIITCQHFKRLPQKKKRRMRSVQWRASGWIYYCCDTDVWDCCVDNKHQDLWLFYCCCEDTKKEQPPGCCDDLSLLDALHQ